MVDSRNEPLRAQDRRALIVEDAPGMRSYIRAILDAVGFECLEAGDGVDALGFASDGRIDLIITDIEMPRMNGLDFLKSVHEGAFGPNPPPAIVCSGHLDDATYALRPELKMCAARLAKPFRPIDLMLAVAAAVTPASSAV